jgi:Fe2+ transport system protein FeoA
MCLTDVKRGERVHIQRIMEEGLRTQLIRFGITEGSTIECLERIPFGPFMVRHNRQELAIGRNIACRIRVRKA